MAWYGSMTVEPHQSLQLTLAVIPARSAKQMVLVVKATCSDPSQEASGTGFAWSSALGANYAYVPSGPPRSEASLAMSFTQTITGITLELLTWPERKPLGPDACLGVLLSVTSDAAAEPVRALTCEWAA